MYTEEQLKRAFECGVSASIWGAGKKQQIYLTKQLLKTPEWLRQAALRRWCLWSRIAWTDVREWILTPTPPFAPTEQEVEKLVKVAELEVQRLSKAAVEAFNLAKSCRAALREQVEQAKEVTANS